MPRDAGATSCLLEQDGVGMLHGTPQYCFRPPAVPQAIFRHADKQYVSMLFYTCFEQALQ